MNYVGLYIMIIAILFIAVLFAGILKREHEPYGRSVVGSPHSVRDRGQLPVASEKVAQPLKADSVQDLFANEELNSGSREGSEFRSNCYVFAKKKLILRMLLFFGHFWVPVTRQCFNERFRAP